jgi:hypothetical protein
MKLVNTQETALSEHQWDKHQSIMEYTAQQEMRSRDQSFKPFRILPLIHYMSMVQVGFYNSTQEEYGSLTSLIMSARTLTILKVREAIVIPDYDCSPNSLCNELGSKLGGDVGVTILLSQLSLQ